MGNAGGPQHLGTLRREAGGDRAQFFLGLRPLLARVPRLGDIAGPHQPATAVLHADRRQQIVDGLYFGSYF